MDNIDRLLKEDLGIEGDITSKSLFTNEDAQAEGESRIPPQIFNSLYTEYLGSV